MTIYIRRARKRRANPNRSQLTMRTLKRIQAKARSASIARLSGEMAKAAKLDRELDKLVSRLERAGYSDDAFDAEERGREAAYSHPRRKRNPMRRKTRRRRNPQNNYKLIHEKTGREIKIGDIVTSFRGEQATVTGFDPPHSSASTGRIYVRENYGDQSAYYPSVFGAKIVKRTENPRRRRNPQHTYARHSGLGKFSDSVAEFLYNQGLDGADEQTGSVDELGWFGLLIYKDDPLSIEYDKSGWNTKSYKAAIIAEYGDGSVDYELFTKIGDARKKWRGIEKKYSSFYRGE